MGIGPIDNQFTEKEMKIRKSLVLCAGMAALGFGAPADAMGPGVAMAPAAGKMMAAGAAAIGAAIFGSAAMGAAGMGAAAGAAGMGAAGTGMAGMGTSAAPHMVEGASAPGAAMDPGHAMQPRMTDSTMQTPMRTPAEQNSATKAMKMEGAEAGEHPMPR